MNLTKYKGNVYTPDTLEIVKKIERLFVPEKIKDGVILNRETKTGREIHIDASCSLSRIWSFVIPLGVTPWNRYPEDGYGKNLYHVYGPHQTMMDILMASGRGDAVWSSFETAAQIEAGLYDGPQKLECEIQTHLFRLGYNPGPIDGQIGPQTIRALIEAGIKDRAEIAIEKLRRMKTPMKNHPPAKKRLGHVSGDNIKITSIQSFGGVRAIRLDSNVQFEVESPGRLILDVQ